jgi:F-type H+-transporting ATPase subunit delta
MNDSKISVRYSKALFQTALEKKNIDRVNDDMIFISEILTAREAREFLSNPVIPPSKKSAIFHKMFEGNIENISLSLIDLTVKNGRESFLPSIARNFIHDTLKYKGITEATLTTAIAVDPKIKKQVSDFISKVFSTKVELHEMVKPEIIGGFILRIEDNLIDASVKNKLRKIKKELLGSSVFSK